MQSTELTQTIPLIVRKRRLDFSALRADVDIDIKSKGVNKTDATITDRTPKLTEEETELLRLFRLLNAIGKKEAIQRTTELVCLSRYSRLVPFRAWRENEKNNTCIGSSSAAVRVFKL